jgi:hypothetical protein
MCSGVIVPVSQGTKADCGIAELGRLQGCEFRPGVGWAKELVARAKATEQVNRLWIVKLVKAILNRSKKDKMKC